jgi:hypothetical protein
MTYIYSQEVKPKSKTAIIMCTYLRYKNLPKTYNSLNNQTNLDFDFYISDNSDNDPHILNTTKKLAGEAKYNVFIKQDKNKYSIFSRFMLAKDLAEEEYTKIIFVDDDQRIPTEFVQDCYDQYEDKVIKSFYAHDIIDNYWSKQPLKLGASGNYAGGGGLMCNADLFLHKDFFTCPEEYYILDDLWISYFGKRIAGYDIKLLKTDLRFIHDDYATAKNLVNEKQKFTDEYILGEGRLGQTYND